MGKAGRGEQGLLGQEDQHGHLLLGGNRTLLGPLAGPYVLPAWR